MTFRDDATLREELSEMTPRLRRYARALTSGSATGSELADDLVHATLMRALGARNIGAPADLAVRLYATVTQLNREMAVSGRQARVVNAGRPVLVSPGRNSPAERPGKLAAALLTLPLEAREALLLVGLESFSHVEAARVLRVSHRVLMSRLTEARATLDAALQSAPRRAAAPARTPTLAAAPGRRQPGHLRLVSSRT